jgi:hypothetical protein
MNSSYVYLLVDPRNKLPFYVGKGMGERCHFHVQEARYYVKRKSLKLNKIRKILSLGMAPEIVKVEENVSDRQAIELECLLIAEMRDLGIPLTNMTDGGDGAKGYKHTPEHIEYISGVLKGRKMPEDVRQKMRKPKSPEGRAAIALARQTSTYRPSEETKRKLSEALRGRPSPMMGRIQSEEARKKMSAAGKGRPKQKVECPNCKRSIAVNTAKRWHFDNCKESVCR